MSRCVLTRFIKTRSYDSGSVAQRWRFNITPSAAKKTTVRKACSVYFYTVIERGKKNKAAKRTNTCVCPVSAVWKLQSGKSGLDILLCTAGARNNARRTDPSSQVWTAQGRRCFHMQSMCHRKMRRSHILLVGSVDVCGRHVTALDKRAFNYMSLRLSRVKASWNWDQCHYTSFQRHPLP